ncbi:unnamed protein product [Sphenostylis stenocarpa]|uniref:Protein kinase domain-containing protein n=1 Tax=Sphenostylis stenocarpa TaxID=92480 RepID=A0AA86SSP4_9FABA|nr:unnamed protein product [Sphenostylis stenocarpa]
MGWKATQKQLTRLTVVLLMALAAAGQALSGCPDSCGSVSIPYPFGVGVSKVTGKDCYMEEHLNLTCKESILYAGNVQILNISLLGQLEMNFFVSSICKSDISKGNANSPTITTASFTISSTDNKFVSVGCDTYGYLNNYINNVKYSTGCLTRCNDENQVNIQSMQTSKGECSGIGCCQVDIPPGMTNISIQAFSFKNFSYSSNLNSCSSSFVVKNGNYTFSLDDLKKLPFDKAPMVVHWRVGNETCFASKDKSNYACSNNSDCEDPPSANGNGYRCKCKAGFEGNPYQGCTDILECKLDKHNCTSQDYCRETPGSFECFCPDGLIGDGTIKGGGCRQKPRPDLFAKIDIGAGAGLIALFIGVSWLYLMYHKRKVLKLKEKFFQQNGGIILRQQLSTRQDSSQSTTIFSAEQLKRATNDFDENLIIGKGGFGTVFKGVLSNNKIVAIKKSKIVDQSQVEQFINEVIILSQINHRNVLTSLVGALVLWVSELRCYFYASLTALSFSQTGLRHDYG